MEDESTSVFTQSPPLLPISRDSTVDRTERVTTGWMVQNSNLDIGDRFFSKTYRLCGPHSLPFNGYRGSFAGVQWPRREFDPLTST